MREDERARWTKLVADFESADLSQREFAQEWGLPISNLRYWIYRLRKESRPLVTDAAERSDHPPEQVTAGEGSRLVPVRVVAPAPKARQPMDGDGNLELALPSGARLRFPAGTDLAYLRALAAATPLASPPCAAVISVTGLAPACLASRRSFVVTFFPSGDEVRIDLRLKEQRNACRVTSRSSSTRAEGAAGSQAGPAPVVPTRTR